MQVWLLEGTPNGPDKDNLRAEYLSILCESLKSEYIHGIWSHITQSATSVANKSSAHYSTDNEVTNKIAAACAVGNLDALRRAVSHDKQLVRERSLIFGRPLALAAAGNHRDVVFAIIKYFEANQHLHPEWQPEDALKHAINVSLNHGFVDIAKLLIQIYNAYCPVLGHCPLLGGSLHFSWLNAAVATGDDALIAKVMALKANQGTSAYYGAFDTACQRGDVRAARMFFSNGYLKLNQDIGKSAGGVGGCGDCPLNYAVKAKIMQLFLDKGANPELVRESWDGFKAAWKKELSWEEAREEWKEERSAIGRSLRR
jgi:hypothetical protein